jgi:hypothetical protein
MINPERVELQNFEIWYSFGIWILTFGIPEMVVP